MEQLQVGRATLTWLNGGVIFPDGGSVFGVVPRSVWLKKYPVNENNQVELRTDPILLQLDGKNILIDTGLGIGKFTEKQSENFGVREESSIDLSLEKLGLQTKDIDMILMTHLHYDHANGLTKKLNSTYVPVFDHIPIYTSEIEWNEMRHPNIRSKNTYWEMNWQSIEKQVRTFRNEVEICKGLKMIHTGGHSNGHSIIVFNDGADCFIHMADLLPTHAHQNSLWVLAFDDYPITSIEQKAKWMAYGYERHAWYIFYHDPYYRALKFDTTGKKIKEVARKRYTYK